MEETRGRRNPTKRDQLNALSFRSFALSHASQIQLERLTISESVVSMDPQGISSCDLDGRGSVGGS